MFPTDGFSYTKTPGGSSVKKSGELLHFLSASPHNKAEGFDAHRP